MTEARAMTAALRRAFHRRHPWLAPGGLLLVLAVLTINVLADGPLIVADQRIREAVQAQASSATWHWLDGSRLAPAQLIVDLGDLKLAIPLLALAALVASARRRTLRPLLTAAAGVVLLLATVVPAKLLIGRPEPGHAGLQSGSLGAFPSGHTSTACVCYVLAVLLLSAGLPARTRRVALAGVTAVCFLVGAALVWCDYHWFTDVAAAWALAAVINQLALRLTTGRAGPGRSAGERPAESRTSSAAP